MAQLAGPGALAPLPRPSPRRLLPLTRLLCQEAPHPVLTARGWVSPAMREELPAGGWGGSFLQPGLVLCCGSMSLRCPGAPLLLLAQGFAPGVLPELAPLGMDHGLCMEGPLGG